VYGLKVLAALVILFIGRIAARWTRRGVERLMAKGKTDPMIIYFDTVETVKRRFDEAGIGIPYPQRDVHIYEHKVA